MQRPTKLKRQPMPPRTAPLAPQSARRRVAAAAQKRAYGAAADAEQCWCSACGQPGATDHSHHFSQKLHQQHVNNERNWVRLCRTCHEVFENDRTAFARGYPDLWRRILADMQAVDARAYERFRLRYPF